jgi:hypothetical protein
MSAAVEVRKPATFPMSERLREAIREYARKTTARWPAPLSTLLSSVSCRRRNERNSNAR